MNRRTLILGGTAAAALGTGVAASFARMGSSADYAEAMARLRAPISNGGDMREVVRLATLAANGHNTQPWRFRLSENAIAILPDFSRRTPAVDPDDHHLFTSLGCAAENLAIACAAIGRPGEVQFDPTGEGLLRFEHRPGIARPSPLYAAIGRRQSARIDFDARPASAEALRLLAAAAESPGVQLILFTDRRQMNRVKDLVIAGNSAQIADVAFVRELKQWMRFNPRSALSQGDGLYTACSGNPALPSWLGRPMFDLAYNAGAENNKYARQIDSASGLALFFGDTESHSSWVEVGRACQRFALQATAIGMKLSFVNQPVEVSGLRPSLAALAGMKGKRPDILMRFGHGPDLPMSPRRPVRDVIGYA